MSEKPWSRVADRQQVLLFCRRAFDALWGKEFC